MFGLKECVEMKSLTYILKTNTNGDLLIIVLLPMILISPHTIFITMIGTANTDLGF